MTDLTPEQKIREIIDNDCCFLVCDKCYGGGHDYENSRDCSECGGTGLTEGRNDYAVQKLLSLIQEEKIKELELLMARYTKIARKNTMHAISPLIIANRLSELQALKQPNGDK